MLLFYLILALVVSFLCSLFESILLSIPPSYVETINKKSGYGKILYKLKTNVEKPLSAILTLNTIAHTIGAAGVGAEAVKIWGDAYLAIVSAVLTILILILTEIIPKSIGAYYWKNLIPLAMYSIRAFIYLTYPFVYLSEFITRLFVSKDNKNKINRNEILAFSEIAKSDNVITEREYLIIKNILNFSKVSVKKVMTPRNVIFSASQNITIDEFLNYNNVNSFTRVPVFDASLDDITGYVHKNDILKKLRENQHSELLKNCKRNLLVTHEDSEINSLFDKMLEQKEQISLVIDEFGGTAGIITMEDIIETLIGQEIIDEHDVDSDMQLLARNRYLRQRLNS